ncbi:MAG: twin-arginine translocase TatA/TatE family subunit [Deltaproteobacteria bacterium]|nr:twin-arginine translocase TatA/TatE family subunit [Deltaproteobacteria bacterium]
MFGYNLGTIIIILVIVLLLFGPRRLPELGDSIGKAIRSFKKAHDEPEVLPKEEAKCPKCNKELALESAFCPHCGHSLNA